MLSKHTGVTRHYVRARAGLELVNCVIDQRIQLTEAHLPRLCLRHTCLLGLDGEGLQTDGSVILDNGFTATSHNEDCTIRLFGAHIGGHLSLSNAQLTNDYGSVLGADGVQVDGNVMLDQGFTATSDSEHGAISLVEAHIGGQLVMIEARVTNRNGPALSGYGLQVDGDVHLYWIAATGHNEYGTIRLGGTRIGGQLNLAGARLADSPSVILNLTNAQLGRVHLPTEVICPKGARSNGQCAHSGRQIDIEDATYTSLVDADRRQWLHLLRWHTANYRPTPYQQLAAVHKAVGHDHDARQILIAQQDDLRTRGDIGGRSARAVLWLWGRLAGYGYRPGRIALALLIVLALAGGMGWWAGHTSTSPGQYAARHTAATPNPGTPCSTLEQIGLGVDRGLPIGTTGIRNSCDLNTATPTGELFTLGIWTLQALAWALATLAVAGYTGLIRKIT
jgi:hypothetical protein